jgi:hypothetical protein
MIVNPALYINEKEMSELREAEKSAIGAAMPMAEEAEYLVMAEG